MGGKSESTQTQTSQTNPYANAAPGLNGILNSLNSMVPGAGSATGAQTGAINTLTANGQAGDPNAAAVSRATAGLLNGGGANNNNAAINQNYLNYQGLLNKTATGGNIGANSALKPALDAASTDVTNSVNGQFAAAGRDMSPSNTQALARGWAQGTAPIIASQYNTDVQRQMDAINGIYNGGNTTYGLLNGANATGNSNIGAGIAADPAAYAAGNAGANTVLQSEAQRFGIPAGQLMTLLGSVSPVAQAFGTQNGTASGTNTMSGAQQFGLLTQGVGNLMPKNPMTFNFG